MKLLLALAMLAAAPAIAQTQYADSSGGFVALNGVSVQNLETFRFDATVGRRLGNGLDAGLRIGVRQGEYSQASQSGFTVGPVAGLARKLGHGLSGRIEGSILYISVTTDYPPSSDRLSRQELTQDLTVTVSRPVHVFGSIRIRPTVGGYATATQQLAAEVPEGVSLGNPGRGLLGGLHLEFLVVFRLLGKDAAFTPVSRIDLRNGDDGTSALYSGGGLRLNL